MSNDEPESLQDVARAALRKHDGVSGRQLEAIAKKKGLKIVATTINHMAAGTYKSRPSRPTLEALAALSGVGLDRVYELARVPYPMKPFRDDLPDDADLLTGAQRRAIVDTIRLFAQQNKALSGLQSEREEVGNDADSSAANQVPEVGPADQPTTRLRAVASGDEGSEAEADEADRIAARERALQEDAEREMNEKKRKREAEWPTDE